MLMMLALRFAESVELLGRAATLQWVQNLGDGRTNLKGFPADADDARLEVGSKMGERMRKDFLLMLMMLGTAALALRFC